MTFPDESRMYPLIEGFLKSNLGCFQTLQEVPFPDSSGRRIDVVGLIRQEDGTASELITVEAKPNLSPKNRRDVIGQAEHEKQLAHRVYVAFPKNIMDASEQDTINEIKEACATKRIGLLAVFETGCEAVFSPKALCQPDPNKLEKIISKFKYEVAEFSGFYFSDFSRVSMYYDRPREYEIAKKKLQRLVEEVVKELKNQKLKTFAIERLGWEESESEMGKFKIGNLENGKIKGIPFIVEMSNRGLSVRVEARRSDYNYTKADLDGIIERLNDDPSLLKENLDRLSKLSDPENSYALCINYSNAYEHDFTMHLHLWNIGNPNVFSSFLDVLKHSREECTGTSFVPYIVLEFKYELERVLPKRKDLIDDIAKRLLQLEETITIFWAYMKYEWE
jgi:hypothetical protein